MAKQTKRPQASRRIWLRARRKELRFSQYAISELVGVDQTQVERWERGMFSPHEDNLAKLAQVLEMSRGELRSG